MKYTHVDREGIRWRFVGSRPVSELADKVMAECGLQWEEPTKKGKTMNDDAKSIEPLREWSKTFADSRIYQAIEAYDTLQRELELLRQERRTKMTDERFNELLAGPLYHPLGMFTITRLTLALRAVVEDCGKLGEVALEKHCKEREEQDHLKSGD